MEPDLLKVIITHVLKIMREYQQLRRLLIINDCFTLPSVVGTVI